MKEIQSVNNLAPATSKDTRIWGSALTHYLALKTDGLYKTQDRLLLLKLELPLSLLTVMFCYRSKMKHTRVVR